MFVKNPNLGVDPNLGVGNFTVNVHSVNYELLVQSHPLD